MLEAKLLHNKTKNKNLKVAIHLLSKLVANTLVNFVNFFQLHNPLTSLSALEKISSENVVWEEWAIPVFLRDNDKNLRESFAWKHE